MRAGTYGFVRRVYGRAFGLERYFRKSWNCKLTSASSTFYREELLNHCNWTRIIQFFENCEKSFNCVQTVRLSFPQFLCYNSWSCLCLYSCPCAYKLMSLWSCCIFAKFAIACILWIFTVFLSRKRGKSNQWNKYGKWCENCWHKSWVNRCTTLCQTTAEKSSFWLLLR